MLLAIRRFTILMAFIVTVCTAATFAEPTPTLRLPPPSRIVPTQFPYREVYQYSFGMPNYLALNGRGPNSGVIADAAGSLYGTTYTEAIPEARLITVVMVLCSS